MGGVIFVGVEEVKRPGRICGSEKAWRGCVRVRRNGEVKRKRKGDV